MMHKQVVLRRSLLDNIKFAIGCIVFTAFGAFLLYEKHFWGIVFILFFGAGGLIYLILMSWRPIAVISDKGISVSHGWGENSVPWENVDRFEVVTQTVYRGVKIEYIGIFATDTKDIVGAGEILQEITKSVTGWEESPALLINTSYRSTKAKKVMRILQEFHHEYKNTLNGDLEFTQMYV